MFRKDLKLIFDKYDADKTGKIDFKELHSLVLDLFQSKLEKLQDIN